MIMLIFNGVVFKLIALIDLGQEVKLIYDSIFKVPSVTRKVINKHSNYFFILHLLKNFSLATCLFLFSIFYFILFF